MVVALFDVGRVYPPIRPPMSGVLIMPLIMMIEEIRPAIFLVLFLPC
jgi:hypothetical protein